MLKSTLTGVVALVAMAATGSQTFAGGFCDRDCDDGYRSYAGYVYEPRVAFYRFGDQGDPREGYAVYYAPPAYYAPIPHEPGVVLRRYPLRLQAWERR